MSFKVGAKVVYPHHGTAVVEARRKIEAFGEKRVYLVLRLVHDDLTVQVPADNADAVGLRPVISDDEVAEVFAVLGKRGVRTPENWSRRFKNHQEMLKSGSIFDTAAVARNIAQREKNGSISAAEKRMLAEAVKTLAGELAFALDVEMEEAEQRVFDAVS
jgi:CarD family transcriptional regulator